MCLNPYRPGVKGTADAEMVRLRQEGKVPEAAWKTWLAAVQEELQQDLKDLDLVHLVRGLRSV